MPPSRHNVARVHRTLNLGFRLAPLLALVLVASLGAASPVSASTTYAYDRFERTTSSGWGSAEAGGSYTELGPAADFHVVSSAGHMKLPGPKAARSALLTGVSKRDVEVTARFRLSKLPTAGAVLLHAVGRSTPNGGAEYRVRLRVRPNGTAHLGGSRLIGSTETAIGRWVALTTKVSAGVEWTLRARFKSAAPTRIRAKAWPSQSATPGTWQYKGSDKHVALQGAGAIGLRGYANKKASGGPFSISIAHFDAVAPGTTAGTTPPPAPTGNAYYVSPSGSDGSAGTLSAPWRTLQKAADTVPPGATVYLRAGTHGAFIMRRSGTATSPITFTAYGSEKPVVDGKKATQYAIKIVGAKHVRVSKLTIRGGLGHDYAGAGITAENSSNIEIRNNLILDNKAWGVRSFNSTYVIIDGNEVTQNAVGIHVGRSGAGTMVTNNLVHHNNKMIVNTSSTNGDDAGGEGVALVMTTGTVTVSGNQIWANRASSYDYGYDGGAFSIFGASNWIISDNVTWDNRTVLETGTDAQKTPCNNGRFTRNVNYGATTVDRTVGMTLRCASNTIVANNVFHGMQHFVFDISHNKGGWGASIAGLQIVNNIMSVSTGKIYGIETHPLPSSVVIDNNLLHNSGTGYLFTVVGVGGTRSIDVFRSWTGRELKGLVGDPRFVNAGSRDYHLRSDSPARDRGRVVAGVTDGYRGSAPDMGRYEY